MYGKYVGLDIGTDSVKITLVKRGFRDTSLLDTWSVELTPGEEQRAIDAVRGIFIQNHLPRSEVAVGTTANPLSVRILKFPFSDTKKINMVYEYELENVSTLELKGKVHDFHLVKGDAGGAEAIVCMFEKESVREVISFAEGFGVDPKMVTFPPLAYGAVSEHVAEEEPVVLVDIGTSVTHFVLFERSGLRRIRSVSTGAATVVEGLAKGLGVSLEEAVSIAETGLNGDYRDSVSAAMEVLSKEIEKTVRFFDLELGAKIGILKLTGGFSRLPGLKEYLSDALDMRVESLFIPELGQKTSLFAQSYALALYGSSSSSKAFNLRKGELSFRGGEREALRPFAVPAALLLLLVVLSFYSSCSTYLELKGQVSAMREEASKEVKAMFPGVGVIANPIEYLKGEVAKEREKLSMFEDIRGGPSPIDMLKAISESIPTEVNMRVDEFSTLGDRKAKLIGKTSRYEDVDKIQAALVDSKKFKSVIRDVAERARNNKIKFQFTIEFK